VTKQPAVPAPAPLVVAASVAAVEGGLVVLLAVLELAALSSERLALGITTATFFALYGAGLAWCAWAITRGRTWARGPILIAQLIQLGVAWNFRGSPTTVLAVGVAVAAAVVLAGMLHPATIDALERSDEPDRD
jgi:hypothetical protein